MTRKTFRIGKDGKIHLLENAIRGQIRDFLRQNGIYHWLNVQSPLSHKGLPDITGHFRDGSGRVFHLEVKTERGKLSKPQILFGERCKEDNIAYCVPRSFEDFEKWFLSIKGN